MSDVQRNVQLAVDQLIEREEERGLQVAVYRHGDQIVEAVGGFAADGRPVTADSLFHVTSTAKGVASTVLHRLAADGILEYDTPVVDLWPEFGANGKERTTVRDVLTHSAGVPAVPAGTTPEDLCDWDKMCELIAGATPWWEPGTRTGYHPQTYGYLVGEIVRRATGHTISEESRRRIAAPLGVEDELFFAVPREALGRVARHEQPDAMHLTAEMAAQMAETVPFFRVLDGWTAAPLGALPDADYCNRVDVLTAEIPAGGVMSARAIARTYAALMGPVDGVRLLSAQRLRDAASVVVSGQDAVLGFPAKRGLGYDIGFQGPLDSPTLFGMAGSGGTAAYADPETGVAIAVAKNRITAGDYSTFTTISAVVAKSL
ncbi:serine hydrolase domain-containing protein [Dactylosporangium sp. AC04546]|uniref:serine hydrolase domain-containing protein n=1 Tax=Dactylosporangium sp. AC04546 TaxID=2862460 RepID=UPI001EDD4E9F|nr:serine hydrolase domain-containing protein [Dactylosporangium sp. AC04546]WVK87083.1 serine hydrolase domain-containing protein [Dactylosporangium sp. AC04546]